jgi:two-component system, NarL family, nitrate/nitrite response regulator NarL
VSKIELLLRAPLLRDGLSSVLTEAGFTVFHRPTQGDNDTILVVDFDNCSDPEIVHAHRSRGVKIVAMAHNAESLEIGPDNITLLSGFLTYDLSIDAFAQCLRLICSGECLFPRDLALERNSPSTLDLQPIWGFHLSRRETEVLSHLAEGRSNKMIAEGLGIAETTVKVHLKSLLRKINVANRTQAAIWALANLPELDATRRGPAPVDADLRAE